jgi:hypothetical protein
MQLFSSPVETLTWAEQDRVDLSMLRERLQLTPTERLQRHQAPLALVEALCDAKREASRAPGRAIADRPLQG